MPLGKLSHKQLQHAYVTLNELSNIIDSDDKSKNSKIIETTNKFYTLIPHDFGVKKPQLIDSKEILNVRSIELKCIVIYCRLMFVNFIYYIGKIRYDTKLDGNQNCL